VTFKPLPAEDRWSSVVIIAFIALVDVLLARWVLARPVDGLSFVVALIILLSFVAAGYLAYRAFGARFQWSTGSTGTR